MRAFPNGSLSAPLAIRIYSAALHGRRLVSPLCPSQSLFSLGFATKIIMGVRASRRVFPRLQMESPLAVGENRVTIARCCAAQIK